MHLTPKETVLWIALVMLPVLTGYFIVGQVTDSIGEIPLHWNASGQVDGWGKPSDLLGLGYIMAGTNALMFLCYATSDKLWEAGLVHGVKSPNSARKILIVTGIFIVALNTAIFEISIHAALSALGV